MVYETLTADIGGSPSRMYVKRFVAGFRAPQKSATVHYGFRHARKVE